MKKKYAYLVSYDFQKEGHLGICYGTSQIYRSTKIKSFEDINEIIRFLNDTIDGASNIAIYNYILVGKCKVK